MSPSRVASPVLSRLLSRCAVMALAFGVSGCAGVFDHFGKPPSFSGVAASRDPIDPTLPAGMPGAEFPQFGSGAYPGVAMGGASDQAAAMNAAAEAAVSRALALGARPDDARMASGGVGAASAQQASLFRGGDSLFQDRRARRVGDILTVVIEIDDSADLSNSTERSRSGTATVGAENTLFGLESVIDRVIPGDAVGLNRGVNATGSTDSAGEGTISRDEAISLRIAAQVVQVLPNGHLVVTGNQEVRVNFELRDLQVAGVIRREDITRRNTITYDRMANARILYGGRGHQTDVQQPGLGQQLVDIISPI
ncbi:MAG: flagellar basal body L-ring protein FlgH [Pseudomonadota bacterium]